MATELPAIGEEEALSLPTQLDGWHRLLVPSPTQTAVIRFISPVRPPGSGQARSDPLAERATAEGGGV